MDDKTIETRDKSDRSNLGELYPTPKTYDELQAERAEVRKVRNSWQSTHPYRDIAIIVFALIVGLAIIVYIALGSVFTRPLFGVPLTALLGLLWAYGLYAGIKAIRSMLDKNPNL